MFNGMIEREKIVVGIAPEYKPFEFKDEKGNIVGFDVDIAKEIAKGLEVSLEIKEYKWAELLPALEKGEIDIVISGMSKVVGFVKTNL